MKIAVLEKINFTPSQKSKLEKLGDVEFYENSSIEECKQRVKNADITMIDWIEPNDFLENMKRDSLLSLMSTGFSWVDLEKAKKLGIAVSNVPDYATEAVAEHIIGLILTVTKRIVSGDKAAKSNNWVQGKLEGIELKNRTIGIIGLGRIGSRVAEICKILGMKILTYNRNPRNKNRIKDVDLDALLKESDLISINCNLNDSSKNLLNKEKLDLIKKDAIIVGATWGVLDLDYLIKKLKNNEIKGFGYDVEIAGKDTKLPKELLELENVVLTPHIAFNTKESKIRQVDICIDNIESFINGTPKNIVN